MFVTQATIKDSSNQRGNRYVSLQYTNTKQEMTHITSEVFSDWLQEHELF